MRVWRCALPVMAAGVGGAAIDEWRHLGISTWLTLCQSRSASPMIALELQWQLLPVMMGLMAAVMAAPLVLAIGQRARRWWWSAQMSGVVACVAAMFASATVCPLILIPTAGRWHNMFAMLSVEALCTTLTVILVACAHEAATRAPQDAMDRRSGLGGISYSPRLASKT